MPETSFLIKMKDAGEQFRQGNQINTINEVNETEEPPRENENVTAEEVVETDAETKELKDEILREMLQIKFTNVEDIEMLCKIKINKKGEKRIERAKIAVKQIINGFEETLIYAAASVITKNKMVNLKAT